MEVDPDVAFAIVTSKCPSLLPLDAAGEITAECKDSEKEFFHAKVELSPEDAQALCVNTVTQWKSPLWRDARSFRITGANCYSLFTFGKKPRTPQDWERKACTIFQPSFRGSAATRYGLEKEEMARGIFQNCSKIKITQLGIVINIYNPWFGFSPDGIYFDPETNAGVLIEIKCPLLGKRMDGRELLKNLKFITEINGEYTLKKQHMYYGQVQLGLALLNFRKCHFIIYSELSDTIIVLPVHRDDNFLNVFLTSLTHTYFTKLLPLFIKNTA